MTKRTPKNHAAAGLPLTVHATLTGLCVAVGPTFRPATRDEVLDAAAQYLTPEHRGRAISAPRDAVDLFRPIVCGRQHETFAVAFLDARHCLIVAEGMFRGTIDGATVYPREVVRRSLELGASAVILAHNHPSGVSEPSEADRAITQKLARALNIVEIRMLDHFVLTNDSYTSMAERGLI